MQWATLPRPACTLTSLFSLILYIYFPGAGPDSRPNICRAGWRAVDTAVTAYLSGSTLCGGNLISSHCFIARFGVGALFPLSSLRVYTNPGLPDSAGCRAAAAGTNPGIDRQTGWTSWAVRRADRWQTSRDSIREGMVGYIMFPTAGSNPQTFSSKLRKNIWVAQLLSGGGGGEQTSFVEIAGNYRISRGKLYPVAP